MRKEEEQLLKVKHKLDEEARHLRHEQKQLEREKELVDADPLSAKDPAREKVRVVAATNDLLCLPHCMPPTQRETSLAREPAPHFGALRSCCAIQRKRWTI